MNKQKPGGIGWCDYTWSPITGCWGPGGTAEKPNRCTYCYAIKMASRIMWMQYQRKLDAGVSDKELMDFLENDPFAPTFHPERLSEPAKVKKPSKVFVCSMSDLFGEWVPEEWINQVIGTAQFVAPHHTFQFLTKNPKRLKDFNPWPSNCWVGTTVTNQADADERLPWLLRVAAPVLFVSHEPLLEAIDLTKRNTWDHINWAIIGAMTGPGAVKPETEWVQRLVDQYRAAEKPVFLKDNLNWPEKIQEWPE